MAKRPQFSQTNNFFLSLDVSRSAFKAQALHAANAVENDAALPADVRARAVPLRASSLAFNEKLVESEQAPTVEVFGTVRVAADALLRTLLRRVIGVRYDPKSKDYDRFLPQGLEEFNNAEEADYELHFERFVKEMEAETKPFQYPPDDNAPNTPAQDARAMFTRLQNAVKEGDKQTSADERLRLAISADWRTVAIAEWRLWLALGIHFAEQPDYRARVYSYFDFSALWSQGAEEATDDDDPATPPAG